MNSAKLGCYRWHAVADQSALRYAALRTILDNSTMAVQQRGQFHLVLSGGIRRVESTNNCVLSRLIGPHGTSISVMSVVYYRTIQN